MSARPVPGEPSPDFVALGLAAAALALAGTAQAWLRAQPWAGVAGLALAALLFGLAARRAPRAPEPAAAAPPPLSRVFLSLFGLGVALCLVAGVLVYRLVPALTTHLLWAGGLLVLAVSAALAPRGAARPDAWQRRDWLAVAGLLALTLGLFGWHLTSVPPEVHGDDAEVGLDAIRLLADFDLFGAGWFELPRFHSLPTAIGLRIFGIGLFGLRATSVALGIATVLLLFAVARRLWSFEVALLAAVLLAGQRFFIHLSRTGYHYVDTPLLALLALWLLLRLWHDRRWSAAVWCGIALGLGIQTYYASRLVPPLLALTWLLWLRGTPAAERRGRVVAFALVVVAALAVAAPMFGYFAHDWAAFWERTRDTSMFTPAAQAHLAHGYGTQSLAAILLIQLRAAFGLFNLTPDNSMQYGLDGPLFDAVSAALFVLGLGAVLARLAERRAQMVLVWILLPLIAGAALTIDAPFYPRISGLVPFAVLAVALALAECWRLARRTLPDRRGTWLAATLLAAAVLLIYSGNLRSYFIDYAPSHRHSPGVEISAFVRRHGAGKTTYMVGGAPAFFIRHGAIAFQTHGYATRDIEDLTGALASGRLDPAKSLFIVMPQGVHLVPQLEASLGPLELQTHRNRRGDVAFLTAVPHAAGEAADPPELLRQGHPPGALARGFSTALDLGARAARAVLVAGAVLFAGLALLAWRGRTPRYGAGALRVPWRERIAGWRAWLFGPDEREAACPPPRLLVLALLLAVAAAALALRVYRLVDLPAGFFCDEAGNGYNAFSLLHTGRDETGSFLPLYVWSFGVSYKNPVFLYSAALPMALLGPTELAVRLTAALYGVGTVVAMFFLGRALVGPLVGLLAALLLAVCPWHLHFSRIGYELITLPFFFILATTSLVRWTQGRRTLAQAMVLYGLCLYTYVPAKLFVPLFLSGFTLLYWRQLWARRGETALAALLLLLTAAPVAIFDLTHREQSGSYFRHTTLLAHDEPPAALLRRFADNYGEFFSVRFLFEDSNDKIIRHSVGGHGQLYPYLLPLLGLGVLAALGRRERGPRLALLWLALYPVAPALMNEIPSASRGFIGAPAFCLVAALGAGWGLRLATRLTARCRVTWALQALGAAALLTVVVPAARHYWQLYRDDYPLYAAKYYTGFQFGHRQVVDYFRRHAGEYDLQLLTTRKSNQPDVFLRFYDGVHQPPRTDIMPPYEHAERMRVGSAESYEHYRPAGRRLLFAVLPEEVPLFADPDVKERVIAPDGSTAFVIVAASALQDFVSTWQIGGPLPADDRSAPPDWTPKAPPTSDRWRLYESPGAGVGLNDFFTQNAEDACAWAVNFVTSDVERDVVVHAGFDDSGEVWINGARVRLSAVGGDPEPALVDAERGPARLRAGRNAIVVRSCETIGDWRFYFRLATPDGAPVAGLSWEYGPQPGP